MRSINKFAKQFFLPCSLLFLAVIVFISQLNVVNNAVSRLPKSVCYSSETGIDISFDEIKHFPEDYKASLHARRQAAASTDMSLFPTLVDINLTNDRFNELEAFDFLYGGYFITTKDGVSEYNMNVVIPSQLALKLYHTYDAVGTTILIDNREYTVCGVYQEIKSSLYKLFDSSKMNLYLPYYTVADYDNLPNKRLYLSDGANLFSDNMIGKAAKQLEKMVHYNVADNFTNATKMLKQNISLTLFLCGITLAALIMWFAYKYMPKAIKQKRPIQWIAIISCTAAALALISLSCFQPFIPTDFLPPDNIFDISHYTKAIIGNVQLHNGLEAINSKFYYSAVMIATTAIQSIVVWLLVLVFAIQTARICSRCNKSTGK